MKDTIVSILIGLFFLAMIGGGLWWRYSTFTDCRANGMGFWSCLYMVSK